MGIYGLNWKRLLLEVLSWRHLILSVSNSRGLNELKWVEIVLLPSGKCPFRHQNVYDVYLQEAISHQLAADLAYAVTNNATLANNYMARADERLREARFIDATENSLDTIEANEFTNARL